MPTNSPSNPDLQAAALDYAQRGWPVFPLRPREKTPLTNHGVLDATLDLELIHAVWQLYPDANIGLRTGIAFDVLDIDGPEGRASFADLAPFYRHMGPAAATGKGHHLLFAVTGARNGANLRPKIDFRGVNGYIVAAPSIHPLGHQYYWLEQNPLDLPIPDAPSWLVELVSPAMPATLVTRAKPTNPLADDYDLVGEFMEIGVRLRREGNDRFKGKCPFHADDTPSLTIYNGSQSFYCFGCGAWGDVINLFNWKRTGHLR